MINEINGWWAGPPTLFWITCQKVEAPNRVPKRLPRVAPPHWAQPEVCGKSPRFEKNKWANLQKIGDKYILYLMYIYKSIKMGRYIYICIYVIIYIYTFRDRISQMMEVLPVLPPTTNKST